MRSYVSLRTVLAMLGLELCSQPLPPLNNPQHHTTQHGEEESLLFVFQSPSFISIQRCYKGNNYKAFRLTVVIVVLAPVVVTAMASAMTTKLSSTSPPFNPNRVLVRDQSSSPVPPSSAYLSRSRSSSPYPSKANNANSNAIAKHTFQYQG